MGRKIEEIRRQRALVPQHPPSFERRRTTRRVMGSRQRGFTRAGGSTSGISRLADTERRLAASTAKSKLLRAIAKKFGPLGLALTIKELSDLTERQLWESDQERKYKSGELARPAGET